MSTMQFSKFHERYHGGYHISVHIILSVLWGLLSSLQEVTAANQGTFYSKVVFPLEVVPSFATKALVGY